MYNTFKYNLLNNWNFIRWFRLAISVFIIIQSIQLHDIFFGLFGCFFLFQAITNTGCCVANGCSVPLNNKDHTEEIEFTEVKNK